MKKILSYPFLFVMGMMLLVVSCKSDKKKYTAEEEFIRPASIDYTKQDSTDINVLVNNYISAFRQKNFDLASSMLYTVHNDSIFPLTSDAKKQYIDAYSHMPVFDCKVDAFVLRSDKNNEVRLAVQILSNGNIDKNIGVTRICLNPVKIGNKWYLTLLDKNAEGVEDVYNK